MKVLFLSDIKGIGRRMEIKEVSDGYARNFLLPKKLAVVADAKHLTIKTEFEKKKTAHHIALEDMAKKLKKAEFSFRVKAGEKGEVFGSVSKDDIKKRLKDEGFTVTDIDLKKSLKGLGPHKVSLELGEGVQSEVVVTLTAQS